jgi:hypothetical protein
VPSPAPPKRSIRRKFGTWAQLAETTAFLLETSSFPAVKEGGEKYFSLFLKKSQI